MPSTTAPRTRRPSSGPARIALAPPDAPSWMADAIIAGGGHLVGSAEADALVWGAPRNPEQLAALLAEHHHLAWVQLPFAGIENFVHLVDDERSWTCGKGVYAEPVAEMALALALAGMRHVGAYARASQWERPHGRNLLGANVAILGGGGICESLLRLLAPFDCHVTVVRNRVAEMDGADEVLAADRYVEALADADLAILALPLTPETEGMISRDELEQMQRHAWLVNVARGRHIVTADLVRALQEGVIGGAALDVTDPEPLPADHPLWGQANCIITPHVGNTPEMAVPLLSERITANVRRFAAGAELIGPIHADLGY